ncbi:MAG TPA: stage V sporulation protein AD, partial [Firmicutes bacterium]|nr:stage V sporulation protein AD [Bacillota bacterium]
MAVKVGNQTWQLMRAPVVIETATVAGPLEGEGPLFADYDGVYAEPVAGERSFEAAEKEMMLNACFTALQKAGKTPSDVDIFLAGDLLNQTITSGFSALELKIPYLGLYGACSSSAESLIVASALVEAGFAQVVLAAVSSHNSASERQYRYPTEYGVHRKPTAQWTVTGAG